MRSAGIKKARYAGFVRTLRTVTVKAAGAAQGCEHSAQMSDDPQRSLCRRSGQGQKVRHRRDGARSGRGMRSIVRRDSGESYEAFLTQLAEASGIGDRSRSATGRGVCKSALDQRTPVDRRPKGGLNGIKRD